MALLFMDMQELYLYELYKATMERGGEYLLEDEMNPLSDLGIRRNLAIKCRNALRDKEFLSLESSGDRLGYQISEKGMEHIEEQLLSDETPRANSALGVAQSKAAMIELGTPPSDPQLNLSDSPPSASTHFLTSYNIKNTDRTEIPASDRFISRSDNQKNWDEAVQSLDGVIAEADQTNNFDNLSDSEVTHLRQILRTGRELFDQAQVRESTIRATLLPALVWVRDNLNGFAISTAAGVAVLAIGKLLGLI
jgi:hypothetical protein